MYYIKMSENAEKPPISPKKRGRKPKKGLQESSSFSSDLNENITIQIEDTIKETNFNDNIIDSDNDDINDNNLVQPMSINDKPVAKKRGRKPKGGKIIQQIIPITNVKETKPNVILHLKCSLKDLNSNTLFDPNIDSFSFNKSNYSFEMDNFNSIINSSVKIPEYDFDADICYDADTINNKDNDIREIWKKLKVLEHNLHINNACNKKSACFWDTCEFDNPPVYIPKCYVNGTYQVYGCFCSPECAVAHLMEENIDSSIKFERYQLINHIYSKVYNYSKNIKPAPNPFYMLEKYIGNLTIQEYRALLSNERLFLVVDKPLTRIMPELHEDNDDFIINNKIIPSNTYQIKKKLQKKQTKTNILSERFGLTNN